MNEEITEQLLTFEQCRDEIIKLGKFELDSDKWIPHQKSYITVLINRINIKNSIIFNTLSFPEETTFSERIYNILYNQSTYKIRKCKMCTNTVKFRTVSLGYAQYCCKKCAKSSPESQIIRKQNYFKKTGYYVPAQNPEVKQKIKNTNLERTGYETPLQNPEARQKGVETSIRNYGCKHPMQNEDFRKKRDNDYFERTGYRNPSQNPETKEKLKSTNLEKIGYEHPFLDPKYQQERKEVFLEKYGVDNPFKSKEIMEKVCQERFERTGYYYNTQDPEHKDLVSKHYFEKTGYTHPSRNPEVQKKRAEERTKCGKVSYSKISQELFWNIYNNISCDLQNDSCFATLNKEFARWDSINSTGYFYDFCIVSLKFIIEFDGNYWHSLNGVKERDQQKQEFIENKGYKVVRIDEADYYMNKQKIVDYCLNEINILHNMITNNR